MTDWNLAFDYAAIFILILISVWYLHEKRIPMKRHAFFWVFLNTVLFATIFEIGATLAARYVDIIGYNTFFVILTLQSVFIDLTPLSLAYYLLLNSHTDFVKRRWVPRLFQGCAFVIIAAVVSNYFYRWVFVFEQGKFQVLWGSLITYGIDAAMVITSFVTILRHKQKFAFLKASPLSFNFVCGVLACIFQLVLYVPMLNLMLTLLCLTLFYYQQNTSMVIDGVTKQFNRKFLGEYISNAFYEEKSFGVIVVAMDDFKMINKTYGVDTGDNLLLQVGSFLEQLKFGQLVFRFGSDQFCVILQKNQDTIEKVAKDIEDRFCHPWYPKGEVSVMMSASICCMTCPKDAGSFGELVEVIDYSMAVAKKTKKGCITNVDEVELERIQRDKAIEKAIKVAVDREDLMVYYQPIFSVEKGVYNSAEALVRLNDEKLGWISPDEFIPIAEKNGLIIEMGDIIFKKVCQFIRDFELAKTAVEYIEVNISPVQLMQFDFADRIIALMEQFDVKPEQINMEITETANMSIAAVIEKNILKLVEYGISLSLDDYGSGNANIGYINQLPFKIIKIDKGIIWDSFKNSKAGTTLEYTIGMLNALDLFIVAEGVETKEMMERLAEFGCHYMQGWYYSKAVPDSEFMKLIEMS
ncbi:MAG: bifunctional diguanylate cyclase/phosphodiesterase [Lachnospiraceae bacterium]|nr:bifunctional diguanylate cyclase/phosphodiesterase [Lachnospiraceae bacterium]